MEGQDAFLRAAVWHVQEDHCGVDEGMLGIELGVEGAGIVPEGGVFYGDGAAGVELPGELVELFDGDFLAVGVGFDLLDVAAEIAYFVERVPGRHLES